MSDAKGDKSKASAILGISRPTLYRALRKFSGSQV